MDCGVWISYRPILDGLHRHRHSVTALPQTSQLNLTCRDYFFRGWKRTRREGSDQDGSGGTGREKQSENPKYVNKVRGRDERKEGGERRNCKTTSIKNNVGYIYIYIYSVYIKAYMRFDIWPPPPQFFSANSHTDAAVVECWLVVLMHLSFIIMTVAFSLQVLPKHTEGRGVRAENSNFRSDIGAETFDDAYILMNHKRSWCWRGDGSRMNNLKSLWYGSLCCWLLISFLRVII